MTTNNFMQKQYGLTDNPFTGNTADRSWVDTWVDREEQVTKWNSVITKLQNPRKNYIVFIIGDYGEGKTQSLFKVLDDSKDISEVYSAYFTFKGEQKPRTPGLEFMFRIFKSIDFNALHGKYKEKLGAAIDAIPEELGEVKNVLEICFFAESELRDLSRYFLRGEIRPNNNQLKKLQIIRKIDDIDIAKEYLTGMLIVFKNLGVNTLLLAVDEVEYLFSLVPKSQQSIYVALLRGLYDFPSDVKFAGDNAAKIAMFLAVSTDGYRRLKENEKQETSTGGPTTPLLDRIDISTNLGALTRQATRDLVAKRLHFDRVGKKHFDPLIPFDESFIDLIWDLTKGNPRDIIDKCNYVLDAGIEKGITLLDKNTAIQLLTERREI